jgi:hypothetical protein
LEDFTDLDAFARMLEALDDVEPVGKGLKGTVPEEVVLLHRIFMYDRYIRTMNVTNSPALFPVATPGN